MWPGRLFLFVAIESLEIEDVLLGKTIRPLRQARDRSIVQDDEGWPLLRPVQRVAVAVESIGRKAAADNALPIAHGTLF
jgi:hypothetical protein